MPTPSTALAGYLAQLYITAFPSVAIGTLPLVDSGDHKTFNAGNVAKQAWDNKSAFTVQVKQDEVQTITITGGPTGGSFTLIFGGQTTAAINWNSTAAQLQTALQALSSIGANNCIVTGGPGPGTPFTVEFTGTLGYASQALIALGTNSLTGGVSPNVTPARSQAGQAFTNASASTYVINYPIGQVVFNSVLLGTPAVQITAGNYFTFAFLGFAHEWDPTTSAAALDSTVFTNPPTSWKTFIGSLQNATVKLMKWWVDGSMLANLTGNVLIVLLLYTGANANQRFQGYVWLTAEQIHAAANAIVTDDTTWQVTGQFFFIPS